MLAGQGAIRTAFPLALVLALAACTAGPSISPTSSSSPSPDAGGDDCAARAVPPFVAESGFSGANALGHVIRIVCDFDTNPAGVRDRAPGTPGREAVATYLGDVLAGYGWRVSRQDFSGLEYLDLDKGSVASFIDAESCSTADRERLRSLTFSNVVAERGTGRDLWVLMAHYEAKAEASSDPDPANRTRPVPGANDGASGVAVWLEAARLLSERSTATVRILLVDGEDGFEDCHPLAGSLFHAMTMGGPERSRIRGVYLLDMVGDPQPGFCYGHNAPGLRDAVVGSAAALGVTALAEAPDCRVVDDHTAFTDLGVPALDLIDFRGGRYPPYWHTLQDVPSTLSAEMLADVGRVMVRTLERLTAS